MASIFPAKKCPLFIVQSDKSIFHNVINEYPGSESEQKNNLSPSLQLNAVVFFSYSKQKHSNQKGSLDFRRLPGPVFDPPRREMSVGSFS